MTRRNLDARSVGGARTSGVVAGMVLKERFRGRTTPLVPRADEKEFGFRGNHFQRVGTISRSFDLVNNGVFDGGMRRHISEFGWTVTQSIPSTGNESSGLREYIESQL